MCAAVLCWSTHSNGSTLPASSSYQPTIVTKFVLQVSVSFADDDVLAQVVELVFTAESCVKQGFYGVHFRQDGSCNTYLELEDRVSLWVPEVWYCLRLGC